MVLDGAVDLSTTLVAHVDARSTTKVALMSTAPGAPTSAFSVRSARL
jgi:hypothetical protein